MDNRLNEIRRKISFLRTEMLRFEHTIRQQVNRDEDCSDESMQLMAMLLQLRSQRGQGQALANQDNLKTFHRNDPWLAIEPGR